MSAHVLLNLLIELAGEKRYNARLRSILSLFSQQV